MPKSLSAITISFSVTCEGRGRRERKEKKKSEVSKLAHSCFTTYVHRELTEICYTEHCIDIYSRHIFRR